MRRSILKLIAEQSPEHPACFESQAQWVEWLSSAHVAGIPVVRRVDIGKSSDNRRTFFAVLPVGQQSHCQDCSEFRQQRMKAELRCFPVRPRVAPSNDKQANAPQVEPAAVASFTEPERRARGPFDALFDSEVSA